MSDPFVSIITVNYNGKKWIEKCFQSLEKLDYPRERFEIILGDNASTDDSCDYTAQHFPSVKVLKFSKNYGFCKANNLCAQEAKGEWLVLINNDTYVTPNWLRRLVDGVTSNSKIAVGASKILFPHLGEGKLINAAGGVLFPSGGGMYDGWMELDGESWAQQRPTGFACGAGVIVKKDFFLQTGGLDEYYFYSTEEMDLGFRAWAMGHEVHYIPATMYHYMGSTSYRGKGVTPIAEYLITRNNLYFMIKNYRSGLLLKGLILYDIKTLLKILGAIRCGSWRTVALVLKAKWDVLSNLKEILKRRKAFQKQRKVHDRELLKKGVVLGVRKTIDRHLRAMKQMKKYTPGSYYDTDDRMTVKVDEDGDQIFVKL